MNVATDTESSCTLVACDGEYTSSASSSLPTATTSAVHVQHVLKIVARPRDAVESRCTTATRTLSLLRSDADSAARVAVALFATLPDALGLGFSLAALGLGSFCWCWSLPSSHKGWSFNLSPSPLRLTPGPTSSRWSAAAQEMRSALLQLFFAAASQSRVNWNFLISEFAEFCTCIDYLCIILLLIIRGSS